MNPTQCQKAQLRRARFPALLKLRSIALHKIWLPRGLYRLIPGFYVLAGGAALLSAILLDGWGWLIPYAILFAGMAVHAATLITIARVKGRRKMARVKLPDISKNTENKLPD